MSESNPNRQARPDQREAMPRTITLEKCSNCGRVIGSNEPPQRWQGKTVCPECRQTLASPASKAAQVACPSCGSNDTASAQMVYESGTMLSTFGGAAYGGLGGRGGRGGRGIELGGGASIGQSLAAVRTAPPRRKSLAPLIVALVCAAVAVAMVIYSFARAEAVESLDRESAMLARKIAILPAMLCVGFAVVGWSRPKWNREKFPGLYQRWRSLWICRRCGHSFKP